MSNLIDLSAYDAICSGLDLESSGSYEQLPDGLYVVSIDKAELKTSKKDEPYLSFQCRIQSQDYNNKCLFPTYFFKPKSIVFTLQAFRGLGKLITKASEITPIIDSGELVGTLVELIQSTKNGYTGYKWGKLLALPGETGAPVEPMVKEKAPVENATDDLPF